MILSATTVHHLTFARLDASGTRLRLRALHGVLQDRQIFSSARTDHLADAGRA